MQFSGVTKKIFENKFLKKAILYNKKQQQEANVCKNSSETFFWNDYPATEISFGRGFL